jgi:pyruvate kinase
MASHADIEQVREELRAIRDRATALEHKYQAELSGVHPAFREGARNLVHYLALRNSYTHDLRNKLRRLGLYSLAHAERNVLGSITAVQTAVDRLVGNGAADIEALEAALQRTNPSADEHRQAILGPSPKGREVSIMVTLPSEAADNPDLVTEMLAAGMNLARINCAHDDPDTWRLMVNNVRQAARDAGTECRIVMDLSGPKLRTGELKPGPRVIHIRPKRDPLGRVIAPRRIRLIPDDVLQRGTKIAVIPVPRACIELAQEGDQIRFRDTRGKKRRLAVATKDDKGLVLESFQGAYISTGTHLTLVRNGAGEELSYEVGELPAVEQPLLLHAGDTLIIHRDNIPGEPACQQPEVFQYLSPGETISLNDGKISGVIRDVSEQQLDVEVTKAKPTGSRLRGQRGINFPNSDIRLPGLTATDKTNLVFVAEHADAVSLSFVRKPNDVEALLQELDALSADGLGLIIKVETKKGFKSLPKVMLAAMRRYPIALMIARGDLAVECGWARLAELQEEILWVCEAARVPVMWATQVLEQEAKKGLPSRAEITDAAQSQRADCVMLNKGPHILAAIRTLDSILSRMQTLRFRKTS